MCPAALGKVSATNTARDEHRHARMNVCSA
jgi:hypothetical protein